MMFTSTTWTGRNSDSWKGLPWAGSSAANAAAPTRQAGALVRRAAPRYTPPTTAEE
jgi:hypothetical protein